MKRQQLIEQIRKKKSLLCIGLDPDPEKIPIHLKRYRYPVLEFNRQIIEATHDLCVAYKLNLAFYECTGANGFKILEKTLKLLPAHLFTIADAKRADVAHSSAYYARAYFEWFGFHAITVNPYLGHDSVLPFLQYPDRWTILLALTSNPGAADFQILQTESGTPLYETIIEKSKTWGHTGHMMYVAGATKPLQLQHIRHLLPDHFLLVPGVGAQGGSVTQVCRHAMNRDHALLINASRSILYASSGKNFAQCARQHALSLLHEMKPFF
jgi:orotidine-5'-phosphate decarboxylase